MIHLPPRAGISLKPEHYELILNSLPGIGWLEIHPENYMCPGGKQHHYLDKIAQHYPISMHGVSMSLASAESLNADHLHEWKKLIDQYKPASISEHLAWTQIQGRYSNDLLPVAYTEEALHHFCHNIDEMQDTVNRKILIENPSVYLQFAESEMSEGQFLSEAILRTGCGLLLDVNNIKVSSNNLGLSIEQQLKDYPLTDVEEIHLAGHIKSKLSDGTILLIDNHGTTISDEVWELYKQLLSQIGKPVPTLVEWDTDVPPLDTLIDEAKKVDIALQNLMTERSQQ